MHSLFVSSGESRCELIPGPTPIYHTVYRDQKLVHMLSTGSRGDVVIKCRTKGKRIASKCVPGSILTYRRFKGGVDCSTKFMKGLNIFRRDLKWTVRLLRGVLALSVLNSLRIFEAQVRPREVETSAFVLNLGLGLARFETMTDE